MVERICEVCRTIFRAKKADVKRGWARFCSKSCKARDQERRTGQYAALLREHRTRDDEELFTGDGFSNEEYDCNRGPNDPPNF